MTLIQTFTQAPENTSDSRGLNVVVAAVAATSHLSGVSRLAANLVRCLLTRSEIATVHLLVAPWQYNALRSLLPAEEDRLRIHQVRVGTGSLARNLWYYNRLPKLATSLQADIVHLAYPSPLKRAAFECPTIVTLHDLYPYDIPANFGFLKMLYNRAILQQCLRAADTIACVSESTLYRLDMYAPGIALHKAVTIYNCVDAGPAMSAESPIPAWQGEPFLLCVAQHRRNKNIPLAIKVFERLLRENDLAPEIKLIVVGIPGRETKTIRGLIAERGLNNKVLLLQGLSDSQLEWCYGHCELLLAPSVVEGFGLPIVEAMLHHCPIVCSDISAFREVGGSYCTYAKLSSCAEEAFVQAAREAMSSHRFRAAVVDRFSGERVSAEYLRLYQHLQKTYGEAAGSNRFRGVPQLERGRL